MNTQDTGRAIETKTGQTRTCNGAMNTKPAATTIIGKEGTVKSPVDTLTTDGVIIGSKQIASSTTRAKRIGGRPK